MNKATKIHFIIIYALLALIILVSVVADIFIYAVQEGTLQTVRHHSAILHDNSLSTTRDR